MSVLGNMEAVLEVNVPQKNETGESQDVWHEAVRLRGFMDLSSGDSGHTAFHAKIQESTHVFVSDYKPIPATFEAGGKSVRVSPENVRMVADSKRYDVMLMDNPMNLNRQWEIYLKYTGGQ